MRDNCIVIASFVLRAPTKRKGDSGRSGTAESRLTRFFFPSARRVPELKLIPTMTASATAAGEGNGSEVAVVVAEKEERSLRKGEHGGRSRRWWMKPSTGCPARARNCNRNSRASLPFGVYHRRNNPLSSFVSESYRT